MTHPVAVESTTLPVSELVPPIKSMDTCLPFQPIGKYSPTMRPPDAAGCYGVHLTPAGGLLALPRVLMDVVFGSG
jgi:hypothetical protein